LLEVVGINHKTSAFLFTKKNIIEPSLERIERYPLVPVRLIHS